MEIDGPRGPVDRPPSGIEILGRGFVDSWISDFAESENPKSENPKSEIREIQNPKICPDCGGADFWTSVYGATICRSCLPPIDESQVADDRSATDRTSGLPSPVGQAAEPRGLGGDRGGAVASPADDRIADSASELLTLPRGTEWPPEVYSLPWPDSIVPDWLHWRTEIRFVARRAGRETTYVPVDWVRPSWVLVPDPAWPQPKPRWAPNDLPACWRCGLTLFWRDDLGDERCAICSPPRPGDHVRGWFLKRGV